MKRVATAVVALPIIYIVSFGPMAWLSRHGYVSFWSCLALYAPLDWVAKASPAARRFLEWYAMLIGP